MQIYYRIIGLWASIFCIFTIVCLMITFYISIWSSKSASRSQSRSQSTSKSKSLSQQLPHFSNEQRERYTSGLYDYVEKRPIPIMNPDGVLFTSIQFNTGEYTFFQICSWYLSPTAEQKITIYQKIQRELDHIFSGVVFMSQKNEMKVAIKTFMIIILNHINRRKNEIQDTEPTLNQIASIFENTNFGNVKELIDFLIDFGMSGAILMYSDLLGREPVYFIDLCTIVIEDPSLQNRNINSINALRELFVVHSEIYDQLQLETTTYFAISDWFACINRNIKNKKTLYWAMRQYIISMKILSDEFDITEEEETFESNPSFAPINLNLPLLSNTFAIPCFTTTIKSFNSICINFLEKMNQEVLTEEEEKRKEEEKEHFISPPTLLEKIQKIIRKRTETPVRNIIAFIIDFIYHCSIPQDANNHINDLEDLFSNYSQSKLIPLFLNIGMINVEFIIPQNRKISWWLACRELQNLPDASSITNLQQLTDKLASVNNIGSPVSISKQSAALFQNWHQYMQEHFTKKTLGELIIDYANKYTRVQIN